MISSPMLARVLKAAVLRGASDVHAKAGDVFRARVQGELVPLTKQRLTPAQTRALAATFAGMELDDPRLDRLRDFDCSWGISGVGRFRVNVLRQRSSFMVILRVVPFAVPTPENLGLPDVVSRFAELPEGLVLIAGARGSGRTSTIAAMVHHINRSQQRHILILEDPIEFLHRDISSSVTQREIGTDSDDFALALQAAGRQNPDVLVLSELRESSVLERAIRLAESGVLVIAAFSAADAASALVQLVATLPAAERDIGRLRLTGVLRAVVAQRLIPGPAGTRKLVVEWTEATDQLCSVVGTSDDVASLRKAIERAVKDGRAETFARAMVDAGLEQIDLQIPKR